MQEDLYYKSGGSDKEYHITLAPDANLWKVNFSYGRRGGTLKTGTKTQISVTKEKAEIIFRKVRDEKLAEGYQRGAAGPQTVAPATIAVAEWLPQLLNPIEEEEVERLLRDEMWGMQQKYDGENRILGMTTEIGQPFGLNRQGKPVSITRKVADALKYLYSHVGKIVMCAEDMGDTVMVHDLLWLGNTDYRPRPYLSRWLELFHLSPGSYSPLWLGQLFTDTITKKNQYNDFKASGAEGVVFKRLHAPFIPGRPASGGDQLKFKFWKSASFIVSKVNDKASVGLSLYDDDKNLVFVGNVTIPPNYDMPAIGDLVEVRYLYAYKGGSVYQPIYKGLRTDILSTDCKLSQLKYKKEQA